MYIVAAISSCQLLSETSVGIAYEENPSTVNTISRNSRSGGFVLQKRSDFRVEFLVKPSVYLSQPGYSPPFCDQTQSRFFDAPKGPITLALKFLLTTVSFQDCERAARRGRETLLRGRGRHPPGGPGRGRERFRRRRSRGRHCDGGQAFGRDRRQKSTLPESKRLYLVSFPSCATGPPF